jgi:hypothetical protein
MRTWRASLATRLRSDTPREGCLRACGSRTQGSRDRRRRQPRAGGRALRCVRGFSAPYLFFACRETERAQALHRGAEAVVVASLMVPARTTAGILVNFAVCCRTWMLLRLVTSLLAESSDQYSRTPTRVHTTFSSMTSAHSSTSSSRSSCVLSRTRRRSYVPQS